VTQVAAGVYPFLFPRYLLKDRYENLAKIKKIESPLLIIHGTRDSIVPYEHGLKLYEAARQPKLMLSVPGGDHNTVIQDAGEKYFEYLENFLQNNLNDESDDNSNERKCKYKEAEIAPTNEHTVTPKVQISDVEECTL